MMLRTEVDHQAGIVYKHMDLFFWKQDDMSQATTQSNFSITVNLLYSIASYSKGKVPIQALLPSRGRGGVSSAIISLMENENECH